MEYNNETKDLLFYNPNSDEDVIKTRVNEIQEVHKLHNLIKTKR